MGWSFIPPQNTRPYYTDFKVKRNQYLSSLTPHGQYSLPVQARAHLPAKEKNIDLSPAPV
jgi:hypothetical protein